MGATYTALSFADDVSVECVRDLETSSLRRLRDEDVPFFEQNVPQRMEFGERLHPQFLSLPCPTCKTDLAPLPSHARDGYAPLLMRSSAS